MKNITNFFIYILLVLVLFIYFSVIYGERKGEILNKVKTNNSDVLFVGNSSFIRGINPMVIYDKEGITSYVIGTSWAQFPVYQYFIDEVGKNMNPKVIVIDMESFFIKDLQTHDQLHYTVDKMPMNYNKYKLINDDIWEMTTFDKLSFALPILRFHDKWSELKPLDYLKVIPNTTSCNKKYCYGYFAHTGVFNEANNDYLKDNNNVYSTNYKEEITINYIDKIKDYCDKNNKKMLLLIPPHQEWSENQSKILLELSKKKNYDLLDGNEIIKNINIDLNKDFFDVGHLNINGSLKFSKYLSKYLKENYNLEDHRRNNSYSNYKNDLKKWKSYKKDYYNEYYSNLKGGN